MKKNVIYLEDWPVNKLTSDKNKAHLMALKRYNLSLVLKPEVIKQPDLFADPAYNGGF